MADRKHRKIVVRSTERGCLRLSLASPFDGAVA
jgi:hypothetical protein